jgi:hypothetical protein
MEGLVSDIPGTGKPPTFFYSVGKSGPEFGGRENTMNSVVNIHILLLTY